MQIILIFLSLIVLYHIAQTFLVFGLGVTDGVIFSLLKDGLWVLVVVYFFVSNHKKIVPVLKKNYRLLIVFFALVVWSVVLSYLLGVDLMTLIVGIKYDLWPLTILLMAVMVGGLLKTDQLHESQGEMHESTRGLLPVRQNRYSKICILIVVGGIAWQIDKMLFPDLFALWGYGPIGDYVLGGNPPLRYRTGPGGMMRLQGLFSGPNNYGYFLVGFFSVTVMMLYNQRKSGSKKFVITLGTLYLVSLIATLSRGAIVGVGFQLLIAAIWFFPKIRKITVGVCLVGVLGLGVLTVLKPLSTIEHVRSRSEGRQAFTDNPLGYGLGASGPSVHFNGVYLPENQYLQILLDIGLLGFILRIAFRLVVIMRLNQTVLVRSQRSWSQSDRLLISLSLGIAGLAVEGMFLHTLEDSMVIYLLFVSFGVLLGASEKYDPL